MRPGTSFALLFAGCLAGPGQAGIAAAPAEDDLLLDVGIEVFDPGVPKGLSQGQLKEKRIYPDIRRSEGRYFAVELREALQASGEWGAVRVVPKGSAEQDLAVSGTILKSNGKKVELEVQAADATGRVWFTRRYTQAADILAYAEGEEEVKPEPYHKVFARIAADLGSARRRLRPQELKQVRQVTALLFAAELAPEAVQGNLERGRDGRLKLVKLPAEDDPLLARIERIRERDQMLGDTLDEHYQLFHEKMDGSYLSWRMYSYEEQRAIDEIHKKAILRTLLGGAAIVGGILVDAKGGGSAAARDILIIVGAEVVRNGINITREAGVHSAALGELAQSFDGEIEPLQVEDEDRTVKLSGSAEAQFRNWRQILRGVLAAETGAPLDPNAGNAADAAPAAAP